MPAGNDDARLAHNSGEARSSDRGTSIEQIKTTD